ncbi:MAG: hypothetical protein HY644_00880 [Acidobacteria bacterium]|nr:hypothetical protein [Acidobacteriota bacterium]
MRRAFALFVLSLFLPLLLEAKIVVPTPESFTLTTKQGLVLSFTNQLEGFVNNEGAAYVVLNASNKSQQAIRLAPDSFVLRDEAGRQIMGISGKEALSLVVDRVYERSVGYVKFGDADLRDVLKAGNRNYTSKELTEVKLRPHEEIKEKLLFFPRLSKGTYTLEFEGDKVEIRATEEALYFIRSEARKSAPGE